MDAAASQPYLTHQFPRDLYYQIVHALRGALPPPVTDSPEDHIRRDNAIIAEVASLLPATPDEVRLAAQWVAANAQALDCLRHSRLHPSDTAVALKCTAQSASMMRQARGARTQLQRLQAEREKRESNSVARETAAASERAAVTLLAESLASAAPAASAAPVPPQPVPQGQARTLSEAEKYALAHPSHAALIRTLGRQPKKFTGPPMSPEVVHDIVHGGGSILQALVKKPVHRLATAA